MLAEVTVSRDGSVEKTQVVKGHPLLSAGVEQIVKTRKFEPQADAQRSFQLRCDFELPDVAVRDAVEIPGPLHLILLTFPPINYSAQPDVGKEPGS